MISERDLLLQSLSPEDAGWAQFEAEFLGKGPECLLAADLIALAQGQVGPELAAGVQPHLDRCTYCTSWFDAYKKVREKSVPEGPHLPTAGEASSFDRVAAAPRPQPISTAAASGLRPPAGARPKEPSRPPPTPRPSDGMSSIVLTGIFTLLLAGRTQEALSYLQPYLPEVLEALGLDPWLADRLWEYILERAQQQPAHSPALFPGWLRDFAQETLPGDGPRRLPESFNLKPVVARCALRAVQGSPEEPQEVRQFLQAALDRGLQSDAELELFNLSGRAEGPWISDPTCRRVMQKVRGEQRRVAPLFGIN